MIGTETEDLSLSPSLSLCLFFSSLHAGERDRARFSRLGEKTCIGDIPTLSEVSAAAFAGRRMEELSVNRAIRSITQRQANRRIPGPITECRSTGAVARDLNSIPT
jgi:hypothetical protein